MDFRIIFVMKLYAGTKISWQEALVFFSRVTIYQFLVLGAMLLQAFSKLTTDVEIGIILPCFSDIFYLVQFYH